MAFNIPILLINFNRPQKTKEVIEVIQQIKPSRIYFAVDGPRENHPTDRENCEQVKQLVSNLTWPCTVFTLFQEKNLGCGPAPASAISWLFEHEKWGIIIEDDCLPDPSFFSFAEELLKYYEHDERVMQISGSNYLPEVKPEPSASYFFSSIGSIWGWATWRRAWKHYDYHVQDYESVKERGLLKDFFYNRKYTQYVMKMLQQAYDKDPAMSTWDFQWDLAKHLNSGLVIVPATNLVKNKGFTADATHTKEAWPFYDKLKLVPMKFPLEHPKYVFASREYDEQYYVVFHERPLLGRVIKKLALLSGLTLRYTPQLSDN